MKTVCFIPARGGSKGIKNKNICNICSKPLIYWVLNELQTVDIIDEIIVATDSKKIENTVLDFNFDKVHIYKRKAENAKDTSPTIDVVMEYLPNLNKEDNFLLVQTTSPLLEAKNVYEMLSEVNKKGYDSAFGGVKFSRICWTKEGKPIEHNLKNRKRRQDGDYIVVENGSMYFNKVKNILENKSLLSGKIYPYIMKDETFYEIDEPKDIEIIEEFLKKKICIPKIKALLIDCDGVLTDGGMYYSKTGEAMKKFNTLDGAGINKLKKKGIYIAVITGETTEFAIQRAKKLGIDCFSGVKDKLSLAKDIVKKHNITLEETAYIGDDIIDIDLLKAVGFSACPKNAIKEVKKIVNYVTVRKGGNGALRELTDLISEKLNG